VAWQPVSKAEIWDKINAAETRMSVSQHRFWSPIQIQPEKWLQHPYGDQGDGFWVVGIIDRIVVWFNDIEDGFNCSGYRQYGVIEDYLCNQDELEITVQQLLTVVEVGCDADTAR
jgi:hypothetical protein